jgi:NAD kinase
MENISRQSKRERHLKKLNKVYLVGGLVLGMVLGKVVFENGHNTKPSKSETPIQALTNELATDHIVALNGNIPLNDSTTEIIHDPLVVNSTDGRYFAFWEQAPNIHSLGDNGAAQIAHYDKIAQTYQMPVVSVTEGKTGFLVNPNQENVAVVAPLNPN